MLRRPFFVAGLVFGLTSVITASWFYWDLGRTTADAHLRAHENLTRSAQELEFEINRHRVEAGILSRTGEAKLLVGGQAEADSTMSWLRQNFGLTTAETLALFRFDGGQHVELGLFGAKLPDDILRDMLLTARQGRLGRGWFLTNTEPTYAFASPIFRADRVAGALVLAVDLGRIRDIWSLDQSQLSLVGAEGNTVFSNSAWVSSETNASDLLLDKKMPLFRWQLFLRKSLQAELWLVAQRTALVFFSVLILFSAAVFAAFRRQHLIVELEREQQQGIELDRLVQKRTAELGEAQAALMQKERLARFGMTYPAISHEIAQPLTALKAYTENGLKLLEKERSAEAGKNFLAILDLTKRMNRTVANLRAFAQGDHADTRAVDVRNTIGRVIKEAGQSASSGGASLAEIVTIHADPDVEYLAVAGDVRAHQVMLNLLQNAYRAVEEQQDPRIDVHLTAETEKIIVDVIDNGPGIPPEMTEDIFESFVTTRNQTGLGLGLSISRAFVALMGGTLDVVPSSRPEEGAHFRLTLKRWVE
ncbi:ATP-binding protein [uncultured Roseovarius sp.]|uniref:sensor histidine kinase n=1 Tax=uncultured Roseovarius sp. TaxID=293344 RepID=UPI002603E1B6|nr:ATP-binding protein [uncultured Roseovarius sp.]